jgi:hypothetical protein
MLPPKDRTPYLVRKDAISIGELVWGPTAPIDAPTALDLQGLEESERPGFEYVAERVEVELGPHGSFEGSDEIPLSHRGQFVFFRLFTGRLEAMGYTFEAQVT